MVIVLALVVLLVPIPATYKDGGTVQYDALLYDVFDYNMIGSDYYYNVETGEMRCSVLKGTKVNILRFCLYDGTWDDHPEGSDWKQISYEEYKRLKLELRKKEANQADGN